MISRHAAVARALILAGVAFAGYRSVRPLAAAELVVLADGADASTPLALESVASDFGSFADVAEAVEADRQRMSALEQRIKDLESTKAAEPLPAPPASVKEGVTDKPKDKKDDKKPADPYEIGSDKKTSTSWADGFQAQSANKDFRVKVGGRTQVDAVAFSAMSGPNRPPNKGGLDPELADTVDFRRARLRVEGRMYEFYDWACEYDFVNQINVNNEVYPTERDSGPLTAVTDLWMQLREVPILGTVRVGNQKDPYGYEHLTSSRWLNFMERSFSQDAFEGPFNNGFLPGIQVMNSNEEGDVAWQIGEFKNATNPFGFSNSSGGSMTVGRLVYLPVFEDEGRKLIHLGVSGRTMEPRRQYTSFDSVTGLPNGDPINAVRFRSRGSLRNGPPGPLNSIYADSGLLQGTWQNMIGLEFVGNNGPWSFQSEYFGSWLYNARTTSAGPLATNGYQPPPGTKVGTVYFQGGYAEVLYFLTGESRTYSKIEYRFDRPVPHNNFYAVRGGGSGRRLSLSEGAWQVGMRYNYLCLSDGEVNGGVLNGCTLGLNWLLNPNARIYFNYDFTYRDFQNTPFNKVAGKVVPWPSYDGSGWIHGLGTRLAFDF
ncbi:MAG: OprO/OprP family phosphate-selective porin [Pirellulales bacterium]